MKSIEVHCCCKPNALMGWMVVNDEFIVEKGNKQFENKNGDLVSLELENLFLCFDSFTFVAIKSNEKSISWFKQFPNFVENPVGENNVLS